tara:strand:- start:161 stop:412 length:252 start_codon:yes stop_codon:yes gene_type:complete
MTDSIWKIAVFIIGTVGIPTFGWVWNTHTHLNNLRVDYENTKSAVIEMKENTVEIKLVQKDIQHMNEKIDELMILTLEIARKE